MPFRTHIAPTDDGLVIKIHKRELFAGLFLSLLLFAAALVPTARANYLGPDRSVETCDIDCVDGRCWYDGMQDDSGSYVCTIYIDGIVGVNNCPGNPGSTQWSVARCGWPSGHGGVDDVDFTGWTCTQEEETCTTTNYAEATLSSATNCSQEGTNGWCQVQPTIRFTGNEPVSGYRITNVERSSGTLCSINAASGSCNWTPSTADGIYSFNAWAHSNFGDTTRQTAVNYQVDQVAPTLNTNIPSPDGDNGWYISPVTVSASATDATSGVASVEVNVDGSYGSSPSTISRHGAVDVSFRATDNAGWETVSGTTTLNIDTVAPTLNPNIPGVDGANGWYVTAFTVTLAASDATSGVSGSEILLDGAGMGSNSVDIGTDGSYDLAFYARDVAGNESSSGTTTVDLDTVAPGLSSSVPAPDGANGWYVSPVTFSVTGSDATSGVDVEGVNLNGTWYAGSATLSTDGAHTLSFRVTDNAGWETTEDGGTINYDRTPPTMSPQIQGDLVNGAYAPNLTFVVDGQDATSGVAAEDVSIDGGPWQPAGAYRLSGGTHTVEFRVTDSAGNMVSGGALTFLVDNTPPTAAIDKVGCAQGVFEITGVADDNVAVDHATIDLGRGSVSLPVSGGRWMVEIANWPDGDYDVEIYVEDTSGYSSSAARGFRIDSQPPAIEFSESWTWQYAGELSIADNFKVETVMLTFSDGGSVHVTREFDGANYPSRIYWADFLPTVTGSPGYRITVNVQAVDSCGLVSVDSGFMIVPPGATPTSEPPAPQQEARVASVQPTRIVLVPTQVVVIEQDTPQGPVTFIQPIIDYGWMVGLLAFFALCAATLSQAGDPRPAAWAKLLKLRQEKGYTKEEQTHG
jgi:hypothetical protein